MNPITQKIRNALYKNRLPHELVGTAYFLKPKSKIYFELALDKYEELVCRVLSQKTLRDNDRSIKIMAAIIMGDEPRVKALLCSAWRYFVVEEYMKRNACVAYAHSLADDENIIDQLCADVFEADVAKGFVGISNNQIVWNF